MATTTKDRKAASQDAPTKEIADALEAIATATSEAAPFATDELEERVQQIGARLRELHSERAGGDGPDASKPSARQRLAIEQELAALEREQIAVERDIAERAPRRDGYRNVVSEAREDLVTAVQASYAGTAAAAHERLEQLVVDAYDLVYELDAMRLAQGAEYGTGVADHRLQGAHEHLIALGAFLEVQRTGSATSPELWHQRQQARLARG
jgi:hypothetical protein